jgi:hypothetical protein
MNNEVNGRPCGVASLLELVRVNLIHVDPVLIRTATGPGGVAGELALWHSPIGPKGVSWHSRRFPISPTV